MCRLASTPAVLSNPSMLLLPDKRMKLAGRRGRGVGVQNICLSAAAAARSLCADRWAASAHHAANGGRQMNQYPGGLG
jgi:hypothetical protein